MKNALAQVIGYRLISDGGLFLPESFRLQISIGYPGLSLVLNGQARIGFQDFLAAFVPVGLKA